MKCVKGVKELFLRAFLAGDELDIVDEQDVGRAILFTERVGRVRADGLDQVVGKSFRRHVEHPQTLCLANVPDGVEQVRLAQPYPAVQKQRVVRTGWSLGHGHGGRLGQSIARSHHKAVERVARVQVSSGGSIRHLCGRWRWGQQ